MDDVRRSIYNNSLASQLVAITRLGKVWDMTSDYGAYAPTFVMDEIEMTSRRAARNIQWENRSRGRMVWVGVGSIYSEGKVA